MSILLSIVACVVTIISVVLIAVGVKNKVNSCSEMGGIILLVSILMGACYFLNWIIPLIIIFGLLGTIFTFMGTSKDEEETISKLTDKMLEHASKMEFEQAAELRDKIKELENLIN